MKAGDKVRAVRNSLPVRGFMYQEGDLYCKGHEGKVLYVFPEIMRMPFCVVEFRKISRRERVFAFFDDLELV